jgi:hypothetical protein
MNTAPDLDHALDALIDAPAEDATRVHAELAATPDGRRALALYEALCEAPATATVPDFVPPVLARVRAGPAPVAAPGPAARPEPGGWVRLRQLWASLGLPARPALALGAVLAVVLIALAWPGGVGAPGALAGAAFADGATWWLALGGLVTLGGLVAWWLHRR